MIKRIGDIVLIQLSDIDSNIYVIGDTVIDSGTGFNFTRLMMLLRTLKRSLGDFKQVINTHGHFDHIGGNGYFLNAKVLMHESDAPILEKGDMKMSMADFFEGKLAPKKVDQKLKDGDRLKVGNREFEVIHTPGHSPGSICLYSQKEKLLISGDTLFADGVGRTDTPGGDEEALGASLERLSKLSVEKILPGHGDPLLKGGSKAIKDILKGP
jgi:glyoxylase-like metal-dependent hydrolase (beta-lactamase superfamily II)